MSQEFKFVEDLIKSHLGESEVFVEDMTGTKDHLEITVVSDVFKGKLLIEQHQLIMDALKEELKLRIHAVKLHTYTKEKFATLRG